MPAKTMQQEISEDEQELQELIAEFSLRRVLKILKSRKRQLERQRTAEYRDAQSARAKAYKEADRARIAELERQLAQYRGGQIEDEDSVADENAA